MHTKKSRGLGVLNLLSLNEALLMKNLDKFFNRHNLAWVNLVWDNHYRSDSIPLNYKQRLILVENILKTLHKYKSISKVQVKDGRSIVLWHDTWDSSIQSQS
jgi:hypothetical protein